MQQAFIRWPAVKQATQISRSTAWRLERLGLFPRRRQISAQAVGWLEQEVEDWVTSRAVVEGTVPSDGRNRIARRCKAMSSGRVK